ncbi:hypothetical protein [Phaffia rhodozyma]|uniref:Glycosyltransferase family 18 catalytic domain-containing protein n=1 Tax=Phaffia rhodozyma TaxID=264483 RepID=A0A0F7SK57_PHARH|nr:hypothetical protein [Phaffia rhodozyma]
MILGYKNRNWLVIFTGIGLFYYFIHHHAPHVIKVPASYSRLMEVNGQNQKSSDQHSLSNEDEAHALDSLFQVPSIPSVGWENKMKHPNVQVMRDLMECIKNDDCRPNQRKFVVLESMNYREVLHNYMSGENIWARSVLEALDDLGYSYVFARDMAHAGDWVATLGDAVLAVVADEQSIQECYENSEVCLRTVENPLGIRFERLFGPAFFERQIQPLGPKWTLVPEKPDSRRQYLGYSIEKHCMARKVPSYKIRSKKRQVWVLAKWIHFFTDDSFPYSKDIFVRAAKELDVEFIGAWRIEDTDGHVPGVRHLGDGNILTSEKFDEALVSVLAVVGVGAPWISPTPYQSVCFGIPFVNPTIWGGASSQHPFAQQFVGEEHGIYTVVEKDDDMFISQLAKAISKPHDRYVPPHMTRKAMVDRVQSWLTRNSTEMAREVLKSHPERFKGHILV